jgi:hypothetical protein
MTEHGQATVETVGMLPLLVVVALAAGQLLAAGAAAELADHAAEAGAVALLEGADARRAAAGALPGWARSRMTVRVAGSVVLVRLRPPGPIRAVARMLEASGRADAGAAT